MPDHGGGAPSGPGLGGCPAPGQKPRLAPRSSAPCPQGGCQAPGSSACCPQGLFCTLAWRHPRVHPLPNLRGDGLASRPRPDSSFQLCDHEQSPHLSPLENGIFLPTLFTPWDGARIRKLTQGEKCHLPAQRCRAHIGRLSPQVCWACDPHKARLPHHGLSALLHGMLPHDTVVSATPLASSTVPRAGLFLSKKMGGVTALRR